ncbi:MAG: hypothetical protein V4677_00540 [Bacteroidota bacterium]
MKQIISVLTIILLIGSFGCKKKLTDVNKDFIGLWYTHHKFTTPNSSVYKAINITENSSAEYSDRSEGANENVNGKARVKDNKLRIGVKKFTIDEEPVRLGNVGNFWRMKINGEAFYIDKDNPFSSGYSSCSIPFNVFNAGSDTIMATVDGQTYEVPPEYSVSLSVNCFGCPSVYSDDHGNTFTYCNIGCPGTIEVQ